MARPGKENINNVNTSSPKKAAPRVLKRMAASKIRMVKAMLNPKVFTIMKACEMAKVHHTSHYKWMQDDKNYAEAIGATIEQQTQRLEQAANERAMGLEDHKPSDILTMFLLNAKRPNVYRNNAKVELTGGRSRHGATRASLRNLRTLADSQALAIEAQGALLNEQPTKGE